MEPFIAWLRTCRDTSEDEALASWEAMVVRSPELAAEELQCIRAVAELEPPDLVPLMQEHGLVYLHEWKKHHRFQLPYSAYLTWLRKRVAQFSEIAEKHGLPNLTPVEKEAGS
ncbi:hypothetical protein [Streptomyces sp. NPDC001933]|uniref:hypothetical protein n=1 Tax=Streptomyces sp. NPDC001933 TaxID=3364626 RepID=UPI0036C84C39